MEINEKTLIKLMETKKLYSFVLWIYDANYRTFSYESFTGI